MSQAELLIGGLPWEAAFVLGRTEDGVPVRCEARLALEGARVCRARRGADRADRGVVRRGAVVEPDGRFDLSEGPKVVAHATVLSVLEHHT